MGSHLNLEHKTFLGGKLPSCVSACSAVQEIRRDRCQYHCCNMASHNEERTEQPTGLNSVTLLYANLRPHRYVMFYRDCMFKCMHLSGTMGQLIFWVGVHLSYGSSEFPGVPPSTPAAQWGAKRIPSLFFLLPISCPPSLSSHRKAGWVFGQGGCWGRGSGVMVGNGCSLSLPCSSSVAKDNLLLPSCVYAATSSRNVGQKE